MKIIELKQRRKHLTAVVLDTPLDTKELKLQVDAVGYPVLDSSYLSDSKIKVGDCFTEAEFLSIYKESEYVRAREKAFYLIERGSLSKKALIGKLKRNFSEENAIKVADRMEELELINDTRYAERLAEVLLTEKKVAPRKAKMMMAAKGVDRETAALALEGIETDSVEIIAELIRKKYSSKMGDDDGVKKTAAALMRRGFSFSDIREAIKKFNDETELFED